MSENEKNGLSNRTKEIIIIILSIVLVIMIIVVLSGKKQFGDYDKFKSYRPEGYEKIIKENIGNMTNRDEVYYVFSNYIVKRSNSFYKESDNNGLKEEGNITFYYFDNNIEKFNNWKTEGYNDIENIINESSNKEVYAEYKVKR